MPTLCACVSAYRLPPGRSKQTATMNWGGARATKRQRRATKSMCHRAPKSDEKRRRAEHPKDKQPYQKEGNFGTHSHTLTQMISAALGHKRVVKRDLAQCTCNCAGSGRRPGEQVRPEPRLHQPCSRPHTNTTAKNADRTTPHTRTSGNRLTRPPMSRRRRPLT